MTTAAATATHTARVLTLGASKYRLAQALCSCGWTCPARPIADAALAGRDADQHLAAVQA